MPDYEKRCAVLTRENDDLRERIAALEEALGLTLDAPPDADFTPTEMKIIGLMLARGYVRKEAFMTALYASRLDADSIPDIKIIDVLVCKIRPKLEPHGVTIETKWGDGYFIPADKKPKCRELLGLSRAA